MKINRIISIILLSVTLFTACAKTESVAEETTVSETTAKYSDEELELMAQDMPEIVFVMSHHYDNSNIRGLYVTNKGEVKMYDFNNFAPSEKYDITKVYDEIEKATCSEIHIDDKYKLTEEDMFVVSNDEMKDYYKMLLQTDGNIEKFERRFSGNDSGNYKYYGIRKVNSQKEFIFLSGLDDTYEYYSDNLYSSELNVKIQSYIFYAFAPYWSTEIN